MAKVREPLDGHHPNRLGEELAKAKAYLADPDYAAAFFKGLGPKGTFDLLTVNDVDASPWLSGLLWLWGLH